MCTKKFGSNNVKLDIVDGTDEASLVKDRQKIYKSMDVFFICVSQSDRQSWNEVGKWKHEINEECPNAPIFLVLTKDDLRAFNPDPVTTEMLLQKQKELDLEGV